MVTIEIGKIFGISRVFNENPDGSKTVFVYGDSGEVLEVKLDEDSCKAVGMTEDLIKDLLSKSLILTGDILSKQTIQSVVTPEKAVDAYAAADVSAEDLSKMQADLAAKPLMQDGV